MFKITDSGYAVCVSGIPWSTLSRGIFLEWNGVYRNECVRLVVNFTNILTCEITVPKLQFYQDINVKLHSLLRA
jgi:hypothetical protein